MAWGLGLLLGCGGPGKLNTVKVTGKLVQGSQPLAGKKFKPQSNLLPGGAEGYDGYLVGFTRISDGQSFGAVRVDEQGKFTTELPPNAKYKVTVARLVYPPTSAHVQGGGPPAASDPALQEYATAATTPLEIDVGSQDIDEIILEIK